MNEIRKLISLKEDIGETISMNVSNVVSFHETLKLRRTLFNSLGHAPVVNIGVPDGFQNDIMKNIMQTRLQHKLRNMSE